MLHIPYGKSTLLLDDTEMTVLRSHVNELTSDSSGQKLVQDALENPIGTLPLAELAKNKKNCTIIISDHTRPVPSQDIIPLMLQELRKENHDIEITLLVATGFHRQTTREELETKLGKEIIDTERIVVHDCRDEKRNIRIGTLPSGVPLVIDRIAAETELLVSEGFIEPHFFAGFSGGRKSVLPGICDQLTVLGNHRSSFIDNPNARTGVLKNNPIHKDMIAAARMAKLAFIVNVIIDENKRPIAAFAGDLEEAHKKGCELLRTYCEIPATDADIVITSNGGFPLDQNVYQCVKGLSAAEACGCDDATLIICAELEDGHGGDGFYSMLYGCKDVKELYNKIMATSWQDTVPDQWEAQILARILINHQVIFVSPASRKDLLIKMKLGWAPTLNAALDQARKNKGGQASITVIPNGVGVIVKR